MSMRSKLSQALTKGIELERDRCMGLCADLIKGLRASLAKKLMSAGEKHLAETKLKLAMAIMAALQPSYAHTLSFFKGMGFAPTLDNFSHNLVAWNKRQLR